MSNGSGKGNSFQSDYARCERYFYFKHRRHLKHSKAVEGAATIVGTALHEWLRAFYTAEMEGNPFEHCKEQAIAWFHTALQGATAELPEGTDHTQLDKRATTALALLARRANTIWKRLQEGDERTLACELHLTLELPESFIFDNEESPKGNKLTICPELRHYTVQIDRVFDQIKHPDIDEACRVVEDHKSTSASSPKAQAQQFLMNDQSTGYVFAFNKSIAALGNFPRALLEDEHATAIRYDVWRVEGKIDSDAAFHEEIRLVDPQVGSDWYKRLLLTRARMSECWNYPLDLWTASRIAYGPCKLFGKECEFWPICDDPGNEERVIEEEYEETSEEERTPA